MGTSVLRSLVRSLVLPFVFVIILLWAGGDAGWGAGWLFSVLYILGVLANVVLLAVYSPGLIRERGSTPEDYPLWDKLLGAGMSLVGTAALVVVCGLDHRYGWTAPFPGWVVAVSTLVLVGGLAITNWAMVVNRFFSGAVYIQEARGHRVISSGPYAWVRHPGYLGAALFDLAMPFLLSSWWGLLVALLVLAAIIARTRLEDDLLQRQLPGYRAYTQDVHSRLVPRVW